MRSLSRLGSALVSAASALVSAGLVSGGCATYEPNYVYSPTPAREIVRRATTPVGLIEAHVVGARRTEGDRPAAVVVTVRVRRDGETPLFLAPQRMRMKTGTRRGLRLGDVDVEGPLVPAVGGASVLTAAFELIPPADLSDLDFEVLMLQVDLDVADALTPVQLEFRRDEPDHAWWDPWKGPGPGTRLEDSVLSFGFDVAYGMAR